MQYPEWKAPAEDGQVVLWPDAPEIIANVRGNHQALKNAQVRVGNVPLGELRRRQREWLGHDDEQLLIASGHQTELYHPGVWAKDVLTNTIAEKVGGAAYHFSVDTDQPKHLQLRWPTHSHEVRAFWITDDPEVMTAQWAELLDAPSPAQVDQIARALQESGLSFEPVVGGFLASLKRLALQTPNLAAALTNAIHELNWGLGLRHHAMLCSPIWACESYLVFVHHVLARAREFAGHYNAALAEYRREEKVRAASRPMPDLNVTATSIEAPFWLDDVARGTRERGSVWVDGGKLFLVAPGGEELELDASHDGSEAAGKLTQFLRRNNLRLSPRALTLTLFLRLLVADGFVHGIGGGRYDQVTDRLIQAHFGIEPPRFAVTTATMYFPDALGRTRACLPCVKRDGHRLKHSLLGARKRELVEAIAAAPRRSPERRSLFGAMHRELGQAATADARIGAWQQELTETQRREGEEKTLFDRELFFGLQTRERLEELITRYAQLPNAWVGERIIS